MGRHLRLTARVLRDGKLQRITFFVKTVPIDNSHRFIVMDSNVFGTEATVYKKYAPMFNSCLPPGWTFPVAKCYLTRGPQSEGLKNSTTEDEEVIILEDLTARGYRNRENFPPMDLPHCRIVMKTMATFHAASILLEESRKKSHPGDFNASIDLYPEIKENFLVYNEGHVGYECIRLSAETMATAVFKLWPDKFKDVSRNEVLEAIRGAWMEVFEMVKPSKEYPNVLNHGDPWTNNILFSYETGREGREVPVDAKFVDLQIGRYAPPVLDILIFTHACTRRDFRERHMKEILEFYHRALGEILPQQVLDEVLPLERLFEMCHRYRDFGRVISTAYLPIILSENDPLISGGDNATAPLDIEQAVYSDRGDKIAENCVKSESYRRWITESFQECLEILNLWT
ncbi:uncharacterized protein LOC124158620 isoform X6 [Ischnura elegans]|uniref:uncharacterized protein LOC124158620 isoform X6 n=1 Tax=Ischnura elegans TaxID=197161 RepID=UPI001ED89F1D|nr:uncharacterized protein LOC124158620 isoform X6 [Ischnura elegans]